MTVAASVVEYAMNLARAGSAAALALSIGTTEVAANRVGLFADLTASAEQLGMVVGGVTGPAFLRASSLVLATGLKVQDSTFQIVDNVDNTKSIAFQAATQGSGFQLTIDVGAQAANRTASLPVLAGNDTFGMLGVANAWTLANTFSATTAASSSTTGTVIVGNGTAATTVGIGAGKINTGSTITTGDFIKIPNATNNTAAAMCGLVVGAYDGFMGLGADGSVANSMRGVIFSHTDYGPYGYNWGKHTIAQSPYGDGSNFTSQMTLTNGGVWSLTTASAGHTILSTTDSSSTTTGSLSTLGGMSFGSAKSMYGGNFNAAGTLVVAGTSTFNGAPTAQHATQPEWFLTATGSSKTWSVRYRAGITALAFTEVGVAEWFTITNTTGAVAFAGTLACGATTVTGNLTTSAGRVIVTHGTITTSQPAFDATQTWNAGAVTFTGLKLNITNTASAAGSLLIDLQVGGTSRLSLDKFGSALLSQAVNTSGQPYALRVNGGAHTTLTASFESYDVLFALGRTVQFATGALTTQRAFVIDAPTYAFVGASVITNAATLAIVGPPGNGANATITNAWALWVQSGTTRLDGALEVSSSTLIKTNTNFSNGAAAGAGTITNAPAAGNPTKWVPINDNGTVRYFPAW